MHLPVQRTVRGRGRVQIADRVGEPHWTDDVLGVRPPRPVGLEHRGRPGGHHRGKPHPGPPRHAEAAQDHAPRHPNHAAGGQHRARAQHRARHQLHPGAANQRGRPRGPRPQGRRAVDGVGRQHGVRARLRVGVHEPSTTRPRRGHDGGSLGPNGGTTGRPLLHSGVWRGVAPRRARHRGEPSCGSTVPAHHCLERGKRAHDGQRTQRAGRGHPRSLGRLPVVPGAIWGAPHGGRTDPSQRPTARVQKRHRKEHRFAGQRAHSRPEHLVPPGNRLERDDPRGVRGNGTLGAFRTGERRAGVHGQPPCRRVASAHGGSPRTSPEAHLAIGRLSPAAPRGDWVWDGRPLGGGASDERDGRGVHLGPKHVPGRTSLNMHIRAIRPSAD